MPDFYVAWWNVENLFSVEGDPQRIPWLAEKLRVELKGWSKKVLGQKLAQLAKVISSMNGGRGPDLLGVCEVENSAVLEKLLASLKPLGRAYKVVHHDTSDQRGIDVAFVYDSKRLEVNLKEVFTHTILRRTGTRDLFQASFYYYSAFVFDLLCRRFRSRALRAAWQSLARALRRWRRWDQ